MTNKNNKKVMLSAVTPSGQLTLGNLLGALKHWVKLQNSYNCLFFAVDLHAITTRQDPDILRERTYRAIANYIAAGIDPSQATVFVQSHVPEHAELAWILNCFTYMGELSRMTQFKEKSAKDGQGQSIGVGLFEYPVLMAADVLLHRTNLVPVGEDQKQHLELTRDLALRMNNLFGDNLFVVPEIFIPPVGARIMSLQDPLTKMSKSDTDANGIIFLGDSDDEIRKKIKRAVTDSGAEITDDEAKPGIRNLLTIQAAITGKTIAEIVASYAGKQYGHLKAETAEMVVETIRPTRDKTNALLADKASLDLLLKRGAEQARTHAAATLDKVKQSVGFIAR